MCPVDINLGDDDDHAYENRNNLPKPQSAREENPKKVLTRPAIRISNILTGFPRRGSPIPRMMMTSKAVIKTPCQSSSLGKSMQSAIADPRSSARSVAIMAISART